MFQSCETLITKINEWQKAILELEKLADDFLSVNEDRVKAEINMKKQEIVDSQEKYQILTLAEIGGKETLFWPEKELIEELVSKTEAKSWKFNRSEATFKSRIYLQRSGVTIILRLDTRNKRLTCLSLIGSQERSANLPDLDLSKLKSLIEFEAINCGLKNFPIFHGTIRAIDLQGNTNIKIPNDLTFLENLERFNIMNCNLKQLPKLNQNSIKFIDLSGNPFISKTGLKRKYLKAELLFD